MNTRSRIFDQGDWSPMAPFTRLVQEFDRLLEPNGSDRTYPPLNVMQTENEVTVAVEIPGMDVKDLGLEVEEGVLVISGKRSEEPVGEHAEWLLRERQTGGFERRVRLRWDVDTENMTANYSKGVLRITLRRASERRSRKIEITS
ncbi:MAG: HSP20 family protein [Kiritimatiellia bacterium]|jgi:HSP20 family protein